ncbi:unnamed protein product [Prorocentrum cordatum]|uniref:Uncharacterized protein n=1 Tax=Prorocentrum cordatum TaxID=2364126 RepID=A0ABN9YA06_9DINO|nr:unnamed protein product [Polarella glacialis]
MLSRSDSSARVLRRCCSSTSARSILAISICCLAVQALFDAPTGQAVVVTCHGRVVPAQLLLAQLPPELLPPTRHAVLGRLARRLPAPALLQLPPQCLPPRLRRRLGDRRPAEALPAVSLQLRAQVGRAGRSAAARVLAPRGAASCARRSSSEQAVVQVSAGLVAAMPGSPARRRRPRSSRALRGPASAS